MDPERCQFSATPLFSFLADFENSAEGIFAPQGRHLRDDLNVRKKRRTDSDFRREVHFVACFLGEQFRVRFEGRGAHKSKTVTTSFCGPRILLK
jgi:hypothetical protein